MTSTTSFTSSTPPPRTLGSPLSLSVHGRRVEQTRRKRCSRKHSLRTSRGNSAAVDANVSKVDKIEANCSEHSSPEASRWHLLSEPSTQHVGLVLKHSEEDTKGSTCVVSPFRDTILVLVPNLLSGVYLVCFPVVKPTKHTHSRGLMHLFVEPTKRKMIQRHQTVSGKGSPSGAGGGASAAAAAAAATAATATAYTHISSKLEGIEALISALKVCACVLRGWEIDQGLSYSASVDRPYEPPVYGLAGSRPTVHIPFARARSPVRQTRVPPRQVLDICSKPNRVKFAQLLCGFVRQAAQGDSPLSAPVGAAGVGGSYRDAEDAATIPEGNDLKVSARARTTCFSFVSRK